MGQRHQVHSTRRRRLHSACRSPPAAVHVRCAVATAATCQVCQELTRRSCVVHHRTNCGWPVLATSLFQAGVLHGEVFVTDVQVTDPTVTGQLARGSEQVDNAAIGTLQLLRTGTLPQLEHAQPSGTLQSTARRLRPSWPWPTSSPDRQPDVATWIPQRLRENEQEHHGALPVCRGTIRVESV